MNRPELMHEALDRVAEALAEGEPVAALAGPDRTGPIAPTMATIDMLLAKNRAGDRKIWLTEEGNRAEVIG